MNITKYAHACFVLELNGKKLIVDPGEMTPDYGDSQNVVGIVVTHEHSDHFSLKNIEVILKANPEAKVFSTEEVVSKLNSATVAKSGSSVNIGPFNVDFLGEMHQQVHPDFPTCQNIGMLINGSLYYGGDSYVSPSKPVDTLMTPISGPWQKMGEVMDFIAKVNPKVVIPTHDGLNSEAGQAVMLNWLNMLKEKHPFELKPLKPGESTNI